MKAFVKKVNLPDAPAPTKPVTGLDYFERKKLESLARTPHLSDGVKPRVVNTLSDEERAEMMEPWKDGLSPKDIALEMNKEIKYITNKLWYLTNTGILQKKRTKLSEEEIEEIRKEFKNGVKVSDICRQHTIGQKLVKKVTKCPHGDG